MVGLKTFWILIISLLGLSACVPMTKQTECGTNEAFNASLRTCVPVVGGPSSFITVDSFSPANTLTKYKNDVQTVELSVTIKNPFAENYSIEWKRIYNGVSSSIVPLTSGNKSSIYFIPKTQQTNIGNHLFNVLVKDSKGAIVDEHVFTIVINDTPKPIIKSVLPIDFSAEYTPLQGDQLYEVNIANNGAIVSSNFKTDWTLYRSNVLVASASEADNFATTVPSAEHKALFNFNPSTLGVGSYLLMARVSNGSGEIFAERQWGILVRHPSLSPIIGRPIYEAQGIPSFSTKTIAYNGVPFTVSPTYNFIPETVTTPATGAQGNFCVTVASGEGTYAGDSKFVRVNFYLDGVAPAAYSTLTSAGDSTVCLSDSAAILSSIVFNNSDSQSEQSHTLVARVFDEATGIEYSNSDIASGFGTYPITWDFTVKPKNRKPKVLIGTTNIATCSGTTSSQSCSVTSDTSFTVRILLENDDFYQLPANSTQFDYSIRLYEGSALLSSCSGGAYSNGFSCALTIDSWNSLGPIDTVTKNYKILAEISDKGSPIDPTPSTSSSLLWEFPVGSVTETNSSLSLSSFTVPGAVNEGQSISFNVNVNDSEKDNFKYEVRYCSNPTCTTSEKLTEGDVTRTPNSTTHALTVNHTLPEDFLLNLTGLGCHLKKRNETCTVPFFIVVQDKPFAATPMSVQTGNQNVTVKNINPAPVPITSCVTCLSQSTEHKVFTGHPFTIFPFGTYNESNPPANLLSDASVVGAEKPSRYQWYVKSLNAGGNTNIDWTEIPGATGLNLNWTPSLSKENPASKLELKLCIEDQAATVASFDPSTSICTTSWKVQVVNNVSTIHDISLHTSTELATLDSQKGKETAVWYEAPSTFNGVTASAAYVAMIGNDNKIYVKKVLVKSTDGIDTIDSESIISFTAFDGLEGEVKDLSITGTDQELYLAYAASSLEGSFYPQVRRIDISGGKLAPNKHPGKFGFHYDGLTIETTCSSNACPANTIGGEVTVSFSGGSAGISGTINIKTPVQKTITNGGSTVVTGDYSISFGTYDGVSTLCASCQDSIIAQNLAEIINKSTDPRLAGYTASVTASTVTISGAKKDDYFSSATRVIDRLGKIFVMNGSWYLPFIDSSLGGAFKDKVSIFHELTGEPMNNSPLSPKTAFDTTTDLATMTSATAIDNFIDSNNNVWIALVSKGLSTGKLYKLNSSFKIQNETTVFPGISFSDIQLGASSTHAYVMAKSASDLHLGVYDSSAGTEEEFKLSDLTGTTSTYFNKDAIAQYRILPYGSEARIFATSKGAGSDYKLYTSRLKDSSGSWSLSCGDCEPISELRTNVSSFVGLGVAPIRSNPAADYRLSSDGSVTSEGIRDVAFVAFGRITDPSTASCDPALGVFNMQGEGIGATEIFRKILNTDDDDALFRPPFIKNSP